MLKEDKRLQILERTAKEHGYQRSALLEILHVAHELYGYFDRDILAYISKRLDLPPSHVYGVASFYHLFKFRKPGEHIVSVCMGTACYVKGAEEILSAIEREFNVRRGGSTPDGSLSIFVTRCIGACAMAPNITIDNEVVGRAARDIVIEKIRKILGGIKS